jgi:hypothetical protein
MTRVSFAGVINSGISRQDRTVQAGDPLIIERSSSAMRASIAASRRVLGPAEKSEEAAALTLAAYTVLRSPGKINPRDANSQFNFIRVPAWVGEKCPKVGRTRGIDPWTS